MLEIQGGQPNDDDVESSEIITELSAGDKELLEIIQKLLEPCDRITYGERQREVAAKLGKSVRTVRRIVKKWEKQGLAALQTTQRADKGKHRINSQWQKFIINTYKEGNKGSKRITPQQVAIRVQAKAAELGDENYPSYRTVYRVLEVV
ncbi:MAG TPA: helix-turn-helix domain-containing protein [Nodularia sp. (in: cyanobacteria)]|nr:helix-turn-helix domain-containing protein [Nodularia sp. (in: cyanobacteria)]